jgi:hypothetical protein
MKIWIKNMKKALLDFPIQPYWEQDQSGWANATPSAQEIKLRYHYQLIKDAFDDLVDFHEQISARTRAE